MEKIIKSRTSRYAIIIACILISILITRKYMPYDSDIVNSQIFWPDFLKSGMSVFKDWIPTVDSWYLSVYPLHFLFYYIFGSTDVSVVIAATALYLIIIASSVYGITKAITGSEWSSASLILCLLCPAFSYTYGFLVHPFSHNSTNALGLLCIYLALQSYQGRSLLITVLSSLIAIMASVSDPWFLASYLLPLIIGTVIISFKDRSHVKIAFCYALAFTISYSGVIQSFLGIPMHAFTLVKLPVMLENLTQMVFLVGRMLNIFVIQNDISYSLSFITFTCLTLFSLYKLYTLNGIYRFLSFILFFSAAGILSSFVLSYPDVSILSARFFVNLQYICITLSLILTVKFRSVIAAVILALYASGSIYSYSVTPAGLHQKKDETVDFVRFLHQNNLSFGFGSFWRLTHTVTWLSSGKIHVLPIYFNDSDGSIDLKRARAQTMRSWLSNEYLSQQPERQFIAFSKSIGGKCRYDINFCIKGTVAKIGEPSEKLKYEDMVIYVYNKKIQ
ncbi:glycosyltransferase [Cronobacter sakazakii]